MRGLTNCFFICLFIYLFIRLFAFKSVCVKKKSNSIHPFPLISDPFLMRMSDLVGFAKNSIISRVEALLCYPKRV